MVEGFVFGAADTESSVSNASGIPSHKPTPVISVQGVEKAYDLGGHRVDVLRGVDLEIADGSFTGIMGPSGAGKSTLLHLMAALDRADRGSIHVAGNDLHALNDAALTRFRRRTIGLVFQQFNLVPTFSALENIALPGLLDGQGRGARLGRAVELAHRFDLGPRVDHRPDALSGGERQRVAVARALFFAPRVLFADEPTGNLDEARSVDIWTLLRRLVDDDGTTVVMVTHEPAAAAYCDTVAHMRDGRIAAPGDAFRAGAAPPPPSPSSPPPTGTEAGTDNVRSAPVRHA